MNHNYLIVIACGLLSFCGYSHSIAQSSGPEFLSCNDTIVRLCVQDEGVRLPINNQIFLGEVHPDATHGSVHVTRRMTISGGCGNVLNYKVELLLEDSTTVVSLQPLTEVILDTAGQATLVFDTELSPDSVIAQSGIPYNSDCAMNYTIIWTAIDSCDTEVICARRLYLFDCAPPIPGPSASPFTAILPIGCILSMFAKDYDTGSIDDRQSFNQMLFSFEQNSYNPHMQIICPPAFGVELPGSIWIADKGEDYNCNGFIEWHERNKVEYTFNIIFIDHSGVCCEPDLDSTLSGRITTVQGNEGISQVYVSLMQDGHVYPTYVTTENGRYSFEVTPSDEPVRIVPEKNDKHKNGVSTLDLVKIQKHLLGRDTLESPYLLIAADANNSQNVSAIDLIELRKLVLGIYTELPANVSWRFVRTDYVFQDPMDPWSGLPWPAEEIGTITITDITNLDSLDFYGIKIGDVNGTAQPNATQLLPRQSLPPFELKTNQQSYQTGDIIDVPIRISSNQTLSGFQFTMTASGMEIINVLPGKIEITEEHYALFGDQFTMSWFDESTIDVSADDVLFTLQLRATRPGNLNQSLSINSDITDAELYLENEETLLPVLAFHNENDEDGLEIISCSPNPWKDETSISFYLPESDVVYFSLFDIAGRQVYAETQFLKNGYHQHQLKSSDFADRGLMFFEISTLTDSVIKKMVVLE